MFTGSSLKSAVGLEATDAQLNPFHGSVGELNFDPLQIGKKATPRDSRGLETDTAGSLGETAPSNGSSNNWFFSTNSTSTHRRQLYGSDETWQGLFSVIYCRSRETGAKTEVPLKKAAGKSVSKRKLEKVVLFEYFAPKAKRVLLAGSFNHWKAEKTVLSKDSEGKWRVKLTLPHGRYEYRFCVDGVWQNDQKAVECVPNSFGSWNCVIEVQ